MTLLQAVERMVRESPGSALPGQGWPCTVLITHAVIRAAGLQHVGRWRPGGPWWRGMNVWDGTDPYSLMAATAQLTDAMGGSEAMSCLIEREQLEDEDLATWFEQGVWYTVQGARRLLDNGNDGDWGHAFLVRLEPNGELATVLECSASRGLRINGAQWRGGPPDSPIPLRPVLDEHEAGLAISPLWGGA